MKETGHWSRAIADFEASLEYGRELVELETASPRNSRKKGEKHVGIVLNSLGMANLKLADRYNSRDTKYPHKNQYQDTLKAAEQFLIESLEIRERLEDLRSQAITLDGLGQIYHKQKRHQDAEVAFNKSIRIDSEEISNPRGEAIVRTNRGSLFRDMERFDEALEDFRKAEQLLVSINDETGLAKVYNCSRQVYRLMAKQQEGEDAQDSLKRAIASLLKSVEMNTKLKHPEKGLGLIMDDLIELIKELACPQIALQYCDTAIRLIEACEQLRDSSQLNQHLNKLLRQRRNLQAQV